MSRPVVYLAEYRLRRAWGAAAPHALEVEQFKPEAPRQRWLPPLCPRGRIVVGPDELEQP
ncbi:MAG: hypothetical protein AB1830_07795 [Pseudomonadota bacterium]